MKKLNEVVVKVEDISREAAEKAGMHWCAHYNGYFGNHKFFIERGNAGDDVEIVGWVRPDNGELVVMYDHNWQRVAIKTSKGIIRVERTYANRPIQINVLDVNEQYVLLFIDNKYGEYRRIYF